MIHTSHTICHNKPKSGVWVHFSEISEDGVKKVRCQLCPQDKKPWVSVPNATRMAKDLAEEHKTLVKLSMYSLLICRSSWITCSARANLLACRRLHAGLLTYGPPCFRNDR